MTDLGDAGANGGTHSAIYWLLSGPRVLDYDRHATIMARLDGVELAKTRCDKASSSGSSEVRYLSTLRSITIMPQIRTPGTVRSKVDPFVDSAPNRVSSRIHGEPSVLFGKLSDIVPPDGDSLR